jgi:peptidyl-prolyl cis-trans isomerase D
VYALAKAGDLSGVVKTSFGYHVIKLTEIEAGTVKPLSEVRAAITEAVQQEKAAEQFADLQQKLAEVSFEIADNLEEAATAINSTVKVMPLFSRETAVAPFALPKFLDTVFGDEFISAGTNTEVIELAPQHVIVARLVEHLPEKVKTLEEVKAQVQAAVVAKESNTLATAKADALLAQFNEGKDIRELIAAEKLTLQTAAATPRFGGALDAEIRTKAFELPKPVATKPISAGTAALASGDVSLVLVTKVTDVPSTAEPAAAELEQFAQQIGQQHFIAVQEALKQQAEIVRNLPAMTSQDL